MPVTVSRDKWILYKHTCSYEMIKAVALDVKNSCKTDISDLERHRMQERLTALDLYKTRNPEERPLDSINHRINTLEFWMFGYEYKSGGEKKFIFSPLGNLFLKYIADEQKLRKIFIAMMFAMQFPHPANGTSHTFKLYPFRLVFKLLTDKRLNGTLYNYEEELLLPFVKEVTPESYERLVNEILALRELTDEELVRRFQSDEHTYVNTVYEWEYYTQSLLSQVGVINKITGETLCKLYHPSKTGTGSVPTGRKATKGSITINSSCKRFIEDMLESYSCFDRPLNLRDPERLTIDCIKEIYSFYPETLLREIGEPFELSRLLELPKLIEEYSNNPANGTAYLFEDVLAKGFDMFWNVEVVKRGGAGHTDIECLYITKRKKFAVESKSSAYKLLGINAGRLREQREEIGGEYTIVVTSRYVPATLRDIKDCPIVILLASTFAEYLYNHIFHGVRDMDYADFDNIINDNLGRDISKLISAMTLEKFAANS